MATTSQASATKSTSDQYIEIDFELSGASDGLKLHRSSIRSRDQKCEMCADKMYKYTCPRCAIKTCSLECCRKHKIDRDCSGMRDKTAYIAREQFNESALLSDYKYLEENNRLIDTLQRNSVLQEETARQSFGSHENLRKFLHKNFNINLKLMPLESTRHKNNRTRFNKSTNLVSWSLELAFFLHRNERAQNKFFRFNTRAFLFSSEETLANILRKFFRKFKYELLNEEKQHSQLASLYDLTSIEEKSDDNSNNFAILNDLNALYEHVELNTRKKYFIKLDLNTNFEHLLRNRTIVEYPTIYLVRNSDLNKFCVVEEETKFEREQLSDKTVRIQKQEPASDLEEGECDEDEKESVNNKIEHRETRESKDESEEGEISSNEEEKEEEEEEEKRLSENNKKKLKT